MKNHKEKVQKMKHKIPKAAAVFCIVSVMCLCTSCKKTESRYEAVEPQTAQAQSICELATMKCYYHNVAKFMEEDAQGLLWWKKDKHFWMEYAGVVTLGVDASLVEIKVSGDVVTITLPPGKIMDCSVDEKSLSPASYIIDSASADIAAADVTAAVKSAQENMEKAASEDTALLANARQRAQKLLADYVNNIGEAVGKQYQIEWVYTEE